MLVQQVGRCCCCCYCYCCCFAVVVAAVVAAVVFVVAVDDNVVGGRGEGGVEGCKGRETAQQRRETSQTHDDDDNDDGDINDVQVHFNEAIRKAVEEKDRRIQELELSLSNQVTFPIESSSGFDAHDCWLPFRHQCRFISF